MKLKLLSIVLIILTMACTNVDVSRNKGTSDTVVNAVSVKKDSSKSPMAEDRHQVEHVPDFLGLRNKIDEVSKSDLAGVETSDSSGPYVIREHYSDTLSFRMVFVPKTIPKDSVDIHIADSSPNDYQDFICYAFVYPMLDPDKISVHADNMTYPVKVKTYYRKEKEWRFLDSARLKNQEEFGAFEVKCIQEGRRR